MAAHLARLGVPVTLAGCVGDDPAGAGLAAELTAAGVRTALRTVPGVPTGTIVSLVEPGGQRSFLADRGANLALTAADVAGAARRRAPLRVGVHAARSAPPGRRAGDAPARPRGGVHGLGRPRVHGPLAGYGVDRWLADTAGATLLLPNAAEARLLTGCRDPEEAARALAGRYPVVAVKLGADGALWASDGVLVHRPAHPTTVVDTTGAGDAFAAGLLAAWLRAPEGDPAAALDAGLARAAAVVRRPGAR